MVPCRSNQSKVRGVKRLQFQCRDDVQESKVLHTYMNLVIDGTNKRIKLSFKSISRPEDKVEHQRKRIFLRFKTYRSSFSASVYFCKIRYVAARFALALIVSGCSTPRIFFLASRTCICSFSASVYFPKF